MPRDGSATRARILDAAEGLVERNGFAATSVDQILEAAGTSKGAFFHHFDSKRALSRALVERYVDADLGLLQEGLDACLYIAVLTERDLLDDATSAAVQRAITTWRTCFADLLRPALAGRRRPGGPDVDELADHLFATFEGGYLMCRSLASPEPMRAQLRVLRQLVAALLER